MDKQYLKEHNLLDMQKRFQQIYEYSFISSPMLNEEGEDDDDAPQGGEQQGGMPEPPTPPQGGEQQGGMPEPPMPPQGGEQQEDMSEPPMPPQGGEQQGDMPEPPMSPQGDEMDFNAEGEEDEVIDVEDLTQAQEASEEKIEGVDDKLTSLLGVVKKFIKALDQNDKKLEDLRKEFERRNPTEEEKLNLRSLSSFPYNVNPKEYWKEKTKNSNYNVSFDNDIPTSEENKEYVFKKKDLQSFNDKEIADSFTNYNKLSDFIKF